MTIYTVTSTDDPVAELLGRCVVGSYTQRGQALDTCVDYIMERLGVRDDLARSMSRDENHPVAKEFFSERRKDGVTVVRHGCVKKLRGFLRDELGGNSCYHILDGESSWHFDVDENGVEGMMWTVVTWGDSDCEDPNFTTPTAETFTSEESAINSFYRYAVDLKKDRGIPISEGFKSFVFDALKTDHKVQIDLDDGCCVSCVLYHDDAKNVKE